MSLETLALDHLPSAYKVHIALYRNVHNAGFLHSQLLGRNADFEYAFVDASVAFSRVHLLSAVFRAVTAAASDTLRTPNVHSEIVASLSISNNIADAYRRYGISPKTADLLVVKVTDGDERASEAVDEHLKANVEGDRIPFTDDNIAACSDSAKISKYYKLNGVNWLEAIKDPAVKRKETEMIILSSMALRGV